MIFDTNNLTNMISQLREHLQHAMETPFSPETSKAFLKVSGHPPIQDLLSLHKDITQNLSDSAQEYLSLIGILKDMIKLAHTHGAQIFDQRPEQGVSSTTNQTVHNHFYACSLFQKDMSMALYHLKTNPIPPLSPKDRLIDFEGKKAIHHSYLLYRDFQTSAGRTHRRHAATLEPEIPIRSDGEALAYQDAIVLFFCPHASSLINKAMDRIDLTNAILHVSKDIENIDMDQHQKWTESVQKQAILNAQHMLMHIERITFPLQAGYVKKTFNVPPHTPGA